MASNGFSGFRGRGRGSMGSGRPGRGGGNRGRGRGGPGRGRGRDNGPSDSNRETTKKLFIGNLPETIRVSDLKALFSKHGTLAECDIVRDFAFVHYETSEEAEAAVKNLNGIEFQGSNITVELSYSKVRQNPGMGDKNECYRCGEKDHWSKDCPKYPGPGGSVDRGRRGSRGGRGGRGGSERPYSSERPNFSRSRDYEMDRDYFHDVGREPPMSYSEQFFRREAARGTLDRDRDPYSLYRSRYAALAPSLADRYSSRYDPYERRLPVRDQPAYTKDPYARPPPDYYSRGTRDTSSYDPYTSRYAMPPRVTPPRRLAAP